MNYLGIVVIGRNEGNRLKTCLVSLIEQENTIVYVDSGSTNGSTECAIATKRPVQANYLMTTLKNSKSSAELLAEFAQLVKLINLHDLREDELEDIRL